MYINLAQEPLSKESCNVFQDEITTAKLYETALNDNFCQNIQF